MIFKIKFKKMEVSIRNIVIKNTAKKPNTIEKRIVHRVTEIYQTI